MGTNTVSTPGAHSIFRLHTTFPKKPSFKKLSENKIELDNVSLWNIKQKITVK